MVVSTDQTVDTLFGYSRAENYFLGACGVAYKITDRWVAIGYLFFLNGLSERRGEHEELRDRIS